jgi:hypothetical protein
VIARTILPTEESAIVELFRGMRGAIEVPFEEGTQAQWLHDLLEPMVNRVMVCDRRGKSRQGNKGDQVDADELSELPRRGAPLPQNPNKRQAGLMAESQIEPWFAQRDPHHALQSSRTDRETNRGERCERRLNALRAPTDLTISYSGG